MNDDFYDIGDFLKEYFYIKKERNIINENIENDIKIINYKDIISFYDKRTDKYIFGVEIPFTLKLEKNK